jgi:hypothetical protein
VFGIRVPVQIRHRLIGPKQRCSRHHRIFRKIRSWRLPVRRWNRRNCPFWQLVVQQRDAIGLMSPGLLPTTIIITVEGKFPFDIFASPVGLRSFVKAVCGP